MCQKVGNENMKKNSFYKAKIKSTQGLEDHDFIQGNLAQELSTGEVGERVVNYEIEKTKLFSVDRLYSEWVNENK